MTATDTLRRWAEACESAGIKWYLYKQTLLCAKGFEAFPEELDSVQVAVMAKDMPAVLSEVVPRLPLEWDLDKQSFLNRESLVGVVQDQKTVITIDVLCGFESDEERIFLSSEAERIWRSARGNRSLFKLFYAVLGDGLGKPLRKIEKRMHEKAFDSMISMLAESKADAMFFCDCFQKSPPVILQGSTLLRKEMVLCDGESYPAFGNYEDYLEAVYGDYEKGLTDGIGVGLSEEEKQSLRDHQEKCREALAFIRELGEEYALQYHLIAGSVLGPKRHGGMIPWDDDIDIGIRIEEIERFEKIVKKELPVRLPEGFTLKQADANHPYPRMFSKICYNGRCCVDLWPLVPTYTHGKRAQIQWYFGKLITKMHYAKIDHPITQFSKLVKFLNMFVNDKQIMWLARYNERKYSSKKTPAYINLYSVYTRKKELIMRRWLDDPAYMEFDGISVPVVGCTEEYLTHLYGNYMSVPAPWKRISRHIDRF